MQILSSKAQSVILFVEILCGCRKEYEKRNVYPIRIYFLRIGKLGIFVQDTAPTPLSR